MHRLKLVKSISLFTILRSGHCNSGDYKDELSLRHRFRSSSILSARPDCVMPVTTMLGMLKQKDCLMFEASLGYIVTFRMV